MYDLRCVDALTGLASLEAGSVDLIASDLPYGVTHNKWDTIIPLDEMWNEFQRVLSPQGIVALTACQPFTSQLVMSNPKMFKYEIIWEKTMASNQMLANKRPLRIHESILIFYNKYGVYNEQRLEGKPYKSKFAGSNTSTYANGTPSFEIDNDGWRHARSILKVSNPRNKGGHPTQKPVPLFDWIIRTYTNAGQTVLDPTMGSGTTGVAAVGLNRNFIGFDISEEWCDVSRKRIEAVTPEVK